MSKTPNTPNNSDAPNEPSPDPKGEGAPSSTDPASPFHWRNLHLWQIQGLRDVLVVAGVFGILWLGHTLSVVTVPMLLALMLAYLFEPLIQKMLKAKWVSREGAAASIIAAIVLAVLIPLAIGSAFAISQGVSIVSTAGELSNRMIKVVEAIEKQPNVFVEGEFIGFAEADARLESGANETPEGESSDDPIAVPGDGGASDESTADPVSDATNAAATDAQEPHDNPLAALTPQQRKARAKRMADADKAYAQLPNSLQSVVRFVAKDESENTNQSSGVMSYVLHTVQKNASAIQKQVMATDFDPIGGAGSVLGTAKSVLVTLGTIGFGIFLTGFFFFFFSVKYPAIIVSGRGLLPREHRSQLMDLFCKMDAVIAGFVRGRLTIAMIQAVIFTIGYWIIGVPAPLIFGPIVAILSVVPYLALVGLPATMIALTLESNTGFTGTWWWILGAPSAIYVLGQALDDYVWTPMIQGKATDMDTPSILFASIAGGVLGGIYGMLIAIPVAACAKIYIREVFMPHFNNWIDGRSKDFLPIDND